MTMEGVRPCVGGREMRNERSGSEMKQWHGPYFGSNAHASWTKLDKSLVD